MDPAHITDLIELAKATTLSGAGCAALLGLFRLIRVLRQPHSMAKALLRLESPQDKRALIELYRIAHSAPQLKTRKPSPRVK